MGYIYKEIYSRNWLLRLWKPSSTVFRLHAGDQDSGWRHRVRSEGLRVGGRWCQSWSECEGLRVRNTGI